MTGRRDIYFPDREITEHSAEHVLLNGLGGRWAVNGLIDRTTNSWFGEGIDAAVQEGLLSFRTLLGADSGDGLPPPPLKNRNGTDGKRYNVLPGGKPAPAAPDFRVWVEGSQLHAVGTVRSVEELRRLTRRLFEKHGIPRARLDELATITTEKIAPTIDVEVTLRHDAKRAIAKMACNLLAAEHRDLFLRSDFNAVRRFVAEGAGDHVAVCGSVDQGPAIGDFDHLILVAGSASTGRVSGLVTLYGRLHFVVDLGITAALSSDVRLSYRVDPIGGHDRRHAAEDLSLEVPAFAPDDGPQGKVWVAAVTDLVRSTLRHVEISAAIEACWDEAMNGKAEGEEITEQELNLFTHLVMEQVLPRFYTIRTRRER